MELNRDFQRRKDFLSLTPEDERALRGLHSLLGDQTPGFVESFYDHLLSFGETRALIPEGTSTGCPTRRISRVANRSRTT